ncbi:MAG: ATP cone domain-containing protein [Methanobacterium sp.]
MTDVIKRNGDREPYSEEKVRHSVEKAIQDAGLRTQSKKRLIDKVMDDVNQVIKDRDEVTTGKIRNVIINDFEGEWVGDEVPMARAWRNYELKHGIIYKD